MVSSTTDSSGRSRPQTAQQTPLNNEPDAFPSPFSDSHQNPFVKFRRFADDQISSMFNSLFDGSSPFRPSRTQLEWPQFPDVDDIEQQFKKLEADHSNRMENFNRRLKSTPTPDASAQEMAKWGGQPEAAPMPNKAEPAPMSQKAQTSWLDAFGFDGKKKEVIPNDKTENNEPLDAFSISCPFMQPKHPRQANIASVDWLLTDQQYSPLYLNQDLYWKIDEIEYIPAAKPVELSFDQLRIPRWTVAFPGYNALHVPPTPFEERLKDKVRWLDAYEDLMSLEKKGTMRREKFVREGRPTTLPWLFRMVDSGVLGRNWSAPWTHPSARDFQQAFVDMSDGTTIIGDKNRSYWGFGQIAELVQRNGDSAYTSSAEEIRKIYQQSIGLEQRRMLHDALSAREAVNDEITALDPFQIVPTEQASMSEFLKYQETAVPVQSATGVAALEPSPEPVAVIGVVKKIPNNDKHTRGLEDSIAQYLGQMGEEEKAAFHKAYKDLGSAYNEARKRHPLIYEHIERLGADPSAFDRIFEDLQKTFGDNLQSPMVKTPVADHMTQAVQDIQAPEKTFGRRLDLARSAPTEVTSDSPLSNTYFSESSSWSSSMPSDDKPTSIVSTMTTTSSRTLPDGSIETKKVLKKRFANGKEETEECTDILPQSKNHRMSKSFSERFADNSAFAKQLYEEKANEEELKKPAEKQNKKSGWFWN